MVLGITCIVLAFVICFVISPLVSRTGNKTVSVVRVVNDIKSGDEITKNMVSEVKMPNTNQPDNIVSDTKSIIGKYASMDMVKGDYVLKEKVADTPYVENTYFAKLDGDPTITLQESELGEAKWFSREDVPDLPSTISVGQEMITLFKNGGDPLSQ